jgi:hypothetical protein
MFQRVGQGSGPMFQRAGVAAHSGPGPLLAAAGAVAGQIQGYLFVDAGLPIPGQTWMETVPPVLAARVRCTRRCRSGPMRPLPTCS